MQFVTFGNRIATENFNIGFFYKITFTDSTEVECTCIGIGANFVSFQRQEPELLFTLTLDNASTVLSIDFLGGGGTSDYEELDNKPKINNVELVGNKTSSDLGIQSEITAQSPLSSSLVSGLGSAAAADSSDFATAAQGTLAASAIQSAGTGLTKDGTTLNHSNSVTAQTSESFASFTYDAQGHITGSTAATTAQLNAINSGITSTDVGQIDINKTNILLVLNADGQKNKWNFANAPSGVMQNVIINKQADSLTVTANGTWAHIIYGCQNLPAGEYVLQCEITDYSATTETCKIGHEAVTTTLTPITGNGIITHIFTKSTDSSTVQNIYFYANWSGTSNTSNTYKATKIMICDKSLYDISSSHQNYSMTNADLTAAVQAIQAQLANS